MARKNALGRGLGALIEDYDEDMNQSGGTGFRDSYEIKVGEIETNPFQPRSDMDEEALEQLASSVKEIGIIQPITVRKTDDQKYQLIAGERRLRASKLAGLETIPAFIRTADDQAMLEMALIENIQREDLNAIEISLSYQRLIEECKLTQENLSGRVGKKRSTITNYLRLLKLPAEVQLGIKNKKISMGHARAIISIDKPEKQLDIYQKITSKGLSVRQVEDLVRKSNHTEEKTQEKKQEKEKNQEFQELKKQLDNYFNTNVQFQRNEKGNGKIVIPFKSDSELERIIGILDRLNS